MRKESYRNLEEKFNADPDARELFWMGVMIGAAICATIMILLLMSNSLV